MLAGALVLPKFQRSFVWQDADVLLLLDSISRQYPIGTLLLWGSWWRGANVSPEKCRPFEGCAEGGPNSTLVLDGQQRLQTLLLASRPDSRFVWCAESQTFEVGVAKPHEGVFPARWILCRNADDVWNGLTELHKKELWQPAAAEKIVEPPKKKKGVTVQPDLPKALPRTEVQLRLAQYIRQLLEQQTLFASTKIGAVLIPPTSTLDFAREVFRRINTSGCPMSEQDVFGALLE
jgi:hypothetical protein